MPRFINPKHLMGATKNSLSGLVFAWKGEQAFRHEVLVLVILAALLAVTGKDAGQWLLAAIFLAMVINAGIWTYVFLLN